MEIMKQEFFVYSMTGYGRGEIERDGLKFIAEIRSVNHRFLDLHIRYPYGWAFLEEELRKVVKEYVRRGRVDLTISIEGKQEVPRQVEVDWGLVEGYFQAFQELKQRFPVEEKVGVGDLLRINEIWRIEENQDLSGYAEDVLRSARLACSALQQMRIREGNHLARDLEQRLVELQNLISLMREQAPQVVSAYEEKLQSKFAEWIEASPELKERILLEAALIAEKSDISEELTRLDSHVEQFRQALTTGEPIGRRLEFLLQEMNRDINTIGSKANQQKISSYVVESKSILEKMREQVQNLE
jgi:uncharacterized protein (TIGR00255 family)